MEGDLRLCMGLDMPHCVGLDHVAWEMGMVVVGGAIEQPTHLLQIWTACCPEAGCVGSITLGGQCVLQDKGARRWHIGSLPKQATCSGTIVVRAHCEDSILPQLCWL